MPAPTIGAVDTGPECPGNRHPACHCAPRISIFRRWKLGRRQTSYRLPPDLPPHILRDLGLPSRHDGPRIRLTLFW
jgi:hypothetical protein